MVGGSLVPLYIRPWPLGPAHDNMEFALIKSRTAQFKLRFRNDWVTQKLPQIYTANHATFPILIRKITVQICGNFWVTQ